MPASGSSHLSPGTNTLLGDLKEVKAAVRGNLIIMGVTEEVENSSKTKWLKMTLYVSWYQFCMTSSAKQLHNINTASRPTEKFPKIAVNDNGNFPLP